MGNNNKLKYKIILFFVACLFWGCSLENKESKATNASDNHKNNREEYIMNDSLSSSAYTSYNGFLPKEGFVSTPELAVQIAEVILNKIYGEENIEKQKPFSVNLENDIWLIEGHLEQDYLGGVAYMEIRKSNGEILKVLHGK